MSFRTIFNIGDGKPTQEIVFVFAVLWSLSVFSNSWCVGAEVAEEIDAILARANLKDAKVAVQVTDTETGEVLYSHNGRRLMVPASNQKIITGASALMKLGPDYCFETTLWVRGKIADDVLAGNLVLCGGGDPTLGSPSIGEEPLAQFERWADVVRDMGVRSIDGDIVVWNGFFSGDSIPPSWPKEQLWQPYCAPPDAMTFHDNCVRVIVLPGLEVGEPARLELFPDVDILSLQNQCRTTQKGHAIWFSREVASSEIVVGGRVRAGSKGWSGLVTVPDPARFTGEVFRNVLIDRGIDLSGMVKVVGKRAEDFGDDARMIARRRAPLTKALRVMMQDSQNLYAEQVLRTIGAELQGEGTREDGLRVVRRFWISRGVDRRSIVLDDGSGMSRKNRITAEAICHVLHLLWNSDYASQIIDILPEAGEDGTLSTRFQDRRYRGRIHAKTGYLRGVGALSGYARTFSGRMVAFSILINDLYDGGNVRLKNIEDRIARAIVRYGG
jgi:D-alanyl-D-alanine carboxypeptidase/D-alanyl-D-alanine-endopeptidase (penicillin-binding protein 4)